MTPLNIVFILVSIVTVISAVMVVTNQRIMHAALWLILSLLGVAVLFALLEASFFVVVQVMVYVGAIAILIIFAIMLTRKMMTDSGPQLNPNWKLGAGISLGVVAGLVAVLSVWKQAGAVAQAFPKGKDMVLDLGLALVAPDGFMIPFEVASLLLLAGMIGAVYISGEQRKKK